MEGLCVTCLLLLFVSVYWDVDWVPIGRWDDGYIPIGPPGAGRESPCL